MRTTLQKLWSVTVLTVLLLFTSCYVQRHATSKAERKKLKVITRLDDLPAGGKAIMRTPSGKERVINFKKRVKEEDEDAYLVCDNTSGNFASSNEENIFFKIVLNKPCDASGCPDHCRYDGKKRIIAKTTISSAANVNYYSLNTLLKNYTDLNPDSAMKLRVQNNEGRVAAENKNVTINTAYLFCFAKEADEDYHLVVGTKKNVDAANNRFFIIELSGLPDPSDSSYSSLDNALQNFFVMIGSSACSPGYYWFDSGYAPLRIKAKGSLYWDTEHWSTTNNAPHAHGPAELESRLKTVWEIHPVTSISEIE